MTDELKPCLAHPCAGAMKTNLYDASLTCSACQFQVADESEYSALVAGRQAAIDDEKQNPWKAAIIDELIVDCIYSKEHESDPRRALAEAIAWNVKVALDPSASKEARDMQQAAIDAALESVAQRLKLEVTSRGYDPDSVTMRYTEANQVEIKAGMADKCYRIVMDTIGTNPLAERAAEYARGIEFRAGQLAERDARIAELERELLEQADTIVDELVKRRELERELVEARKDAERYRWLRDEDNWGDDSDNRWQILGELTHSDFDNFVDDAMLAEREKG